MKNKGFMITIAVIILLTTAIMVANIASKDVVEATVSRTERIANGDDSKYLVFTEEGEVFQNSDSWFFLKFNSSDLHGQIKAEQHYRFTVHGYRIHWLSAYRNILKAEVVE